MNEEALTKEVRTLAVSATSIQVKCDVDYEMAAVMLKEFKRKEAQVREFFEPLVAKAYASHRALTTRLKETVAPLNEAKKTIGSEMGRYQAELEAVRRAEEEKLRVQLQKEADEKALAEATRLEEVAKIEKAARLAEAARLHEVGKVEEAARLAEAAKLEEEARLKAASTVLDDVPVVQTVLKSAAPKAEGTSVRTFWKYEIVDEAVIPREFLCVDDKALGAYVRQEKDSASIPGVRVYSATSVS